MKTLSKMMILLLILAVSMILIVDKSYSQTPYMTTLSNIAIVTGANVTKQQSYATNRVQAIIGGTWAGEDDQSAPNAGADVTNTTLLTNWGNNAFNFQIGVSAINVRPGGGDDWRWTILTNDAAIGRWYYGIQKAAVTNNIVMGDVLDVKFIVHVTNNATTSTQGWRLFATNISTSPTVENDTNYFGDNGIWYGGGNGVGWADGSDVNALNCLIAANTFNDTIELWSVAVGAPNITITKTISDITLGGVSTGIPIPGATITFNIFVGNTGALANDVIVRDTLLTNDLDYIEGSMANLGALTWTTNSTLITGGVQLTWTKTAPTSLANGESDNLQFEAIIK